MFFVPLFLFPLKSQKPLRPWPGALLLAPLALSLYPFFISACSAISVVNFYNKFIGFFEVSIGRRKGGCQVMKNRPERGFQAFRRAAGIGLKWQKVEPAPPT
jgi:hypothetical protein